MKISLQRVLLLALGVLGMSVAPPSFGAVQYYGFNVIPDDDSDPTNAANGEAQLLLKVFDTSFVDPDDKSFTKVHFQFFNLGPKQMTIAEIYFDDGALLDYYVGSEILTSSVGDVSFSFTDPKTSPPDLPRGNSLDPKFDTSGAYFSADAGSSAPTYGVNNSNSSNPDDWEWVELVYTLDADKIIDDVINQRDQVDPTGETIRVGLHVINFGDGESESFVNVPDGSDSPPAGSSAPVPEPAGLLIWGLLGAGAAGMATARRKRRLAR